MLTKLFTVINRIFFLIKQKLTDRQFLLLSSVLVGISSAFAIIFLKYFAHKIYELAFYLHSNLGLSFVYSLLPLIGIITTVFVVKRFLGGTIEKGTWRIITAITKKNGFLPRKQMYAQILTSSITVGFGGSSGLESPVTITGAAFGSNYARTFRFSKKERTLLLACGVASGIGAAFNAPITGVLFTMEVLLADMGITAFIPLILSAATGALISSVFLSKAILFSFDNISKFDPLNIPFYLLLGLFTGFVAFYHKKTFTKVESYFHSKKWNIYKKALIGALLLCTLIFLFPPLFGEGYASIRFLLEDNPEKILNTTIFKTVNHPAILVVFLGAVVFLKAIATGITLGSGGNGGNFAPAIFVGAYSGFITSFGINQLHFFKHLPVGNFTMVGMAGVVSGLFHAPLTAIFLIAEITGGYSLMIPLMIVSSISFAVSKYFIPESLDGMVLKDQGHMVRDDKDLNTLSSISTHGISESIHLVIYENQYIYELIESLKHHNQAIIPVLSLQGNCIGCIHMENISVLMEHFYEHPNDLVSTMMEPIQYFATKDDNASEILKKIEQSGHQNIALMENFQIVGYIDKSKLLDAYRKQIIDGMVE